jgi:hypothetical protein
MLIGVVIGLLLYPSVASKVYDRISRTSDDTADEIPTIRHLTPAAAPGGVSYDEDQAAEDVEFRAYDAYR